AEHGLSIATRRQPADFLTSHRDDLLHLAQRVGLRVAEVAQQSWLLILVPILAGFFLKDGQSFSQVALSFAHTKPQREFLQGVISDLNQMLADFIRAQLTLAALSWIAYTVFLGLIARLNYPLMAALRIVWRRWRMYAEKRRFGPLNEYSFLTEATPQK